MNKEAKIVDFGKNLAEIRKKRGLSQVQLADMSGVSRRIISHYERLAKRPSLDNIEKIANALNISIEKLLISSQPSKRKKREGEVSHKIMKKVRVIEKLPTRDQNTIFSLIHALAEKNKLKQSK